MIPDSPNKQQLRELSIRNLRGSIAEFPHLREHLIAVSRWAACHAEDLELLRMIDEFTAS